MNFKELEQRVEDIARQLGEHFDAVQILVSSAEDGGTVSITKGVGNWFARVQMAREFVEDDAAYRIARSIAKEVRGFEAEDDDDNESWKDQSQ